MTNHQEMLDALCDLTSADVRMTSSDIDCLDALDKASRAGKPMSLQDKVRLVQMYRNYVLRRNKTSYDESGSDEGAEWGDDDIED